MVVSILCDVDEFWFKVVYVFYVVVEVLDILCCFGWEVFEWEGWCVGFFGIGEYFVDMYGSGIEEESNLSVCLLIRWWGWMFRVIGGMEEFGLVSFEIWVCWSSDRSIRSNWVCIEL